jgi:DNA-directed RNA polymerase specialized sigma24 family protein
MPFRLGLGFAERRKKYQIGGKKQMTMEVKRDFRVLRECISPANVQVMAELITIKQTKSLIGYLGTNAITAHNKVYYDVMHRNEEDYVLSDHYDLVQEVALFLCEHFGKYLDDFLYTSKKGKAITIKAECYYIIKRQLYKRYSVEIKSFSLESFRYKKDEKDLIETSEEEIEASYDRTEKIISLMKLGEKHLIVLNARLQGISYTQIAAMLHCTTAGVHGFRYVMQRRYNKVIREL